MLLSSILESTFLSQPNQRRTIFDVGTDEEESPGGGGSPGAPVDHHLPSLHPRRPPPSSGTDTQKQCGGCAPAFLGCPSSQRCGAGEDETKGGVDLVGHSRTPSILASGDTSIDVLHSDNIERKVH